MMFHCIEAVSVFEGGGCQMPGDTDTETNDAEVRIIIQTMRSIANPAYSTNRGIFDIQCTVYYHQVNVVHMEKI